MRKLLTFAFSLAALAFILGSVSVSEARAQGELGKILRRMDAHNKTLNSVRAGVMMSKLNVQLGESDVKSGTVIYAKRPGKDALVRIDWQRPNETLSVGDGKYTIFQERNKIAYKGSVKDATNKDTKGSSALAFMNMSKAQLDANYTAQYLGEAALSDGTQTVHLKLTPKNKASYQAAELWIDVDGMPRQTKIVENNKDTTTVLLSKPEKNVVLKSSNFEVALPPGTKVQKS